VVSEAKLKRAKICLDNCAQELETLRDINDSAAHKSARIDKLIDCVDWLREAVALAVEDA
jgi:hypothetical protein